MNTPKYTLTLKPELVHSVMQDFAEDSINRRVSFMFLWVDGETVEVVRAFPVENQLWNVYFLRGKSMLDTTETILRDHVENIVYAGPIPKKETA